VKFFVIFAVVFLVTPACVFASEPSNELIQALIAVESGGNDHAIGDRHLNNKAYGPLQIRQPCVDDVNRIWRTNYRAEDMLGNRQLSISVCKAYIALYATEKRLGRQPTAEDMARIWNGGPNGWKKSSTLSYWEKVRKYIK
jgi:hypothetical protein